MKKIVITFLIIIIAVVTFILVGYSQDSVKYKDLIEDYMSELSSKETNATCLYEAKYFGKHWEYVFAWVTEQCYYQEGEKIVRDKSTSKAYKYYLEKDKISSYEVPQEGEQYEASMENLFPLITRGKMEKYSKNLSSVYDNLDERAKKYFNLTDITNTSDAINDTFGAITGIRVKESNKRLKKIEKIDDRTIYGVKDHIYVYDKFHEGVKLTYALKHKYITLDQIEEFLKGEIKTNENAKLEILKDGGTSIYKSDKYTVIACHTLDGNRDIYFGDKDAEYKDGYCK